MQRLAKIVWAALLPVPSVPACCEAIVDRLDPAAWPVLAIMLSDPQVRAVSQPQLARKHRRVPHAIALRMVQWPDPAPWPAWAILLPGPQVRALSQPQRALKHRWVPSAVALRVVPWPPVLPASATAPMQVTAF